MTDVNIMTIKRGAVKLAVFDFDSTLMDGETIDFLADELGFKAEVAAITEQAMEGELDFFASLTRRVALLKGLAKSRVDAVCQALPLTEGAADVVTGLQQRGYKVICFSGGFRNATSHFAAQLGLDGDFSNVLHSEDGILSGLVGGDMMFGFSKGDMLQRLQKLLGISIEDTLAVGDGANDLSMFEYAGTRIAFCAKPILQEAATHIIERRDLREVLTIVDGL